MQSLQVSTGRLQQTRLQRTATASTGGIREHTLPTKFSSHRARTQSTQRLPPSRSASKLVPRVRQVASSQWLCPGCSSHFLAGDQKVWEQNHNSDQGTQRVGKGKGLVRAQWFQFRSSKSLNVPLREEVPGVAEYLKDTERIVHIAFPDRRRLRYLGDGLWRATLKPVTFFTISATPVTDVRTWYEAGALQIASNRVVLDLAGLPPQLRGIDLRLNLRGSLTRVKSSSRNLTECALDGSVNLGVGVDLPLPLSLLPAAAVNAVGTAILDGILAAMDAALRRGLVDDYRKWCILRRSQTGESMHGQEAQVR